MKKCFTINCMRNNNDFDGYEKILRDGTYQAVELFFPYNTNEEQTKLYTERVRKIVDTIKPEVVLHLPHGHNNDLIGTGSSVVVQRMKDAIDYAVSFGSKKLTLHLGSYKEYSTREDAINDVVNVVRELCEYALPKNANIMIENMPGFNELGYSPEEILYIIKRVNMPNLKFIFDTGHAHCSKYPIKEYIYLLKEYLYHIHFSDNNGERDEHKRVNSGTIDFKELFIALNEINYNELHCMEVIFKEYTDLIEYAKDIDIYDKYYK